ncbi:hypothetical protein AG1IA_01431 [Rhizoctonia solani AG-1 IA]|uniref:Uncharacterized protein n=1 Tax=Thanatephorus cucumeris (strain AG1-IA) TaxID=983506 RepID=L8X665_THACA|nr:hypothetical protein AG1IA_01431 [Rhizoctonia solani AG-1 IA]
MNRYIEATAIELQTSIPTFLSSHPNGHIGDSALTDIGHSSLGDRRTALIHSIGLAARPSRSIICRSQAKLTVLTNSRINRLEVRICFRLPHYTHICSYIHSNCIIFLSYTWYKFVHVDDTRLGCVAGQEYFLKLPYFSESALWTMGRLDRDFANRVPPMHSNQHQNRVPNPFCPSVDLRWGFWFCTVLKSASQFKAEKRAPTPKLTECLRWLAMDRVGRCPGDR